MGSSADAASWIRRSTRPVSVLERGGASGAARPLPIGSLPVVRKLHAIWAGRRGGCTNQGEPLVWAASLPRWARP